MIGSLKNKAWNLTPEEWSNVLQGDTEVRRVAQSVKGGCPFPWAPTLLDLTDDCQTTLDMGSGRGELSALLARTGKRTTLLDWSEKNLEFSRALFKELGISGQTRRADMTQRLPFSDGCFDAVFSCGVFEYFSDEDIRKILMEAFRLAKKRVIILVPNAFSLAYRFGKWYMERTKRWVWGGERPFGSLKAYFHAAGSGPVREFSVGTKHSLDFLSMPGGRSMRKAAVALFRLKDHPRPSFMNQGYILITVGEKG